MIEIVPYQAEHARAIDAQASQVHGLTLVNGCYLHNLSVMGPAYTARTGERILGCAGIIDSGMGTGLLWALASKDSGAHFVALIRAVRRLISLHPLRRLEATVELGFRPGCRALELLGFTCEGLMKKYGPDGKHHLRYAKT